MCLMNEQHLPAADDGLKLFEFPNNTDSCNTILQDGEFMNNNFCLGNTSASLAMGVCCPKADVGHVGTSEWRQDQARWNPFFPSQNAMQIIPVLGVQNILLQLHSGRHQNHLCKAPSGLLHVSCGILWIAKVCHVACVLSWHGKVCTIGRATTVRKLRKWLSTAQGAGYGNTPANRARQGWQSSVDRNCKCWWFTMGVCQILLFLIWVGWTPIHKSQLFWCELQGYVRFWPNATLSDWRNRWMSLSPGYWSSKIWSPHHKRLLQGVAEHFETQFW